MSTDTIRGTYGSSHTPCDVFTYTTRRGTWYAVEGSSNVNRTFDDVVDGVNVEELTDFDYFSWTDGINSEEDLERAVEA